MVDGALVPIVFFGIWGIAFIGAVAIALSMDFIDKNNKKKIGGKND